MLEGIDRIAAYTQGKLTVRAILRGIRLTDPWDTFTRTGSVRAYLAYKSAAEPPPGPPALGGAEG